MIYGSVLSPAPVFIIAGLLLVVSVLSFVFFIKVNRRQKQEFDRKLSAYKKAVDELRQREEERIRKEQQEKEEQKKASVAAKLAQTNPVNFPRRIQFMAPNGASYDVPMLESMTIGSNPRCDLYINQKGISDVHCKISYENGVYTLMDMGSRSGTSFNSTPVPANSSIEVRSGVLQIGKLTLFITIDSE